MRKLSVVLLVLILVSACVLIPENTSSIKGKWALSTITLTVLQDYETGYESEILGMYPQFDDYYTGPIMEVTNELLALYMNLPGSSVFGMVGLGNDVITSEDSIHIIVAENDIVSSILNSVTNNDTLGLGYSITDDGQLSILYEIMDDNLAIPQLSIELLFLSYKGDLPRSNWLEYINDDIYESDSVLVDTTSINVDEQQARTLSHEDIDVIRFSAVKDSVYTAQIFSNMNANLVLFDSLGSELGQSVPFDSVSAPISKNYELIEWTASYSGSYYFMVDGSVGYYELLLEENLEIDEMHKALNLQKQLDTRLLSREKVETLLYDMMMDE